MFKPYKREGILKDPENKHKELVKPICNPNLSPALRKGGGESKENRPRGEGRRRGSGKRRNKGTADRIRGD